MRSRKRRQPRKAGKTATSRPARDDELAGPPPREATAVPSDLEQDALRRVLQYHETSPKLSGGDVDADWERAGSVGEEAVGGSVATPDQSVVDELGDALGVPRSPDEAVRTSQEILEKRDERRQQQEG